MNTTDLQCVGYKLDSSFALHISAREGVAGLLGTNFSRCCDFAARLYNMKTKMHFELRKCG
jgi:hypothetical protein